MRDFLKSIAIAGILQCSLGVAVHAQTTINGSRTITGAWDASNAASSKPAKTGTALPQTCGVGEQFFKTDASQGQNLYFCTGSNTWVQMTGGNGSGGGSGGGGGVNVLIYKGDLSGFGEQNLRIPVGPDGATLTADSTQGSGLGYRNATDSDVFANRPLCAPALTGEMYYPTDGLLAYRCNGTAWSAFGPISQVTPFRVKAANSNGVVGTASTLLTSAAAATGNLAVASCSSFPSTVTMVLVDSEIIAGTCSDATFTPIAGGRGYNQTSPAAHSTGVAVIEQLFVWANTLSNSSTQGSSTVAASAGYIALTGVGGSSGSAILTKPIPYGPGASYTVTGGFMMNGLASGDQGCGIGFRQSSNNKQVVVVFHTITYSQTGFVVGAYQFSDVNYSGTYFGDLAAFTMTGNGMYFRLQDTGSQRNIYVSSDGINFVLVHTVSDVDFLTADQAFIECGGGAIPSLASFFSWTEGH